MSMVQQVDKVAEVHCASDDVVLLAATNKLTKAARTWFDFQSGSVLESWSGLKQHLIKMFDQKIPFYAAMQKIEARKWNHVSETFDQYTIDKLTLIHQVDLPESDTINLLIGGIIKSSLRATALSMTVTSVNVFLDKMRQLMLGVSDLEKKSVSQLKGLKSIKRGNMSVL